MATPLSIQLYTVRELLNAETATEVVGEIAKIGYKGVEGIAPGFTAAEFKSFLADHNMVVSSIYGAAPTAENISELVDELEAAGTDHLTGGFWTQDWDSVDSIKRTSEKIQWGIDALAAHGKTYSMHNHWMEFDIIENRIALDWLIEFCPSVQLELDVYWASNFGRHIPVEIVEIYRDRIRLMHVKDGSMVKDAPMVAVGSGQVDVAACIRAAKPEWLIVELDHFDGNMMNAVRDSYTYLVGNGLASGNVAV
jgi:sugar phosphate isomerase/epimerase